MARPLARFVYIVFFLALLIIGYGIFILMSPAKNDDSIHVTGRVLPQELIVSASTEAVDPEKYESVQEFLSAIQPKENMSVPVQKEDFIFAVASPFTNRSMVYTKLQQKKIANNASWNQTEKNGMIKDVFQAYLSGNIFETAGSQEAWSRVYMGKDLEHPSTDILNSIFWLQKTSKSIIEFLENKKNDKDSQELLAYLYDLHGQYDKAKQARTVLCGEHPETCTQFMPTLIHGYVRDAQGNPVQNARVTWLNDDSITALTDSSGAYEIAFNTYPFSHIRIKVQAYGYADGVYTESVNLMYYAKKFVAEHDFVLEKSENVLSVDLWSVEEDGEYFIIRSSRTEYRVPKKGLYFMNGRLFHGKKLSVVLYEFTKQSKLEDLVTVDTFSPVYGYVGSLMKTFGMPYIQFFDENKQELFIKASHPMIIRNRIYHMKELYENADKIYEPLQVQDMEFLVNETKKSSGYPITYDFLIKNHLLRWPAWWTLDRKHGVWESVGIRVLSVEGDVELPFYSWKD